MSLAISLPRREVQLELPLFVPDKARPKAEVIPLERIRWTDEEVEHLRDGLLTHSLHQLTDGRAGAAIKAEVMEWMLSDHIHPFSFIVCCEAGGYDPVEVREGVLAILNRLDRGKSEGA